MSSVLAARRNEMIRLQGVVIGVVCVVASGSLFAQGRAVPKTFDHVRPLGRALAEFKNDRIQIVTSYSYSQANHDTRWLLIEFGALSRTKTTIDRDGIEVVTPDGRLVPHAPPARVRAAEDLSELLLQNSPSRFRLYWYLPYDGLCCPESFRVGAGFYAERRDATLRPMMVDSRGPVWADLLFESPTGQWESGAYALVVRYDGEEGTLPIELR
jgi:hypothetical protein